MWYLWLVLAAYSSLIIRYRHTRKFPVDALIMYKQDLPVWRRGNKRVIIIVDADGPTLLKNIIRTMHGS